MINVRRKREPTIQMKAFIDEWLRIGNAKDAYKKAYPGCKSDKAARACAAKLLANPTLAEYKEKRLKEVESERIATVTEVMEMLTRTMRGEEKDQFGLDSSLQDRLKAAEMIGKRYGMFKERIEIKRTVNMADTLKKARERVLQNANTEE